MLEVKSDTYRLYLTDSNIMLGLWKGSPDTILKVLLFLVYVVSFIMFSIFDVRTECYMRRNIRLELYV